MNSTARANTALNLLMFGGSFLAQWGIGLLVDAARIGLGMDTAGGLRLAFALVLALQRGRLRMAVAWLAATRDRAGGRRARENMMAIEAVSAGQDECAARMLAGAASACRGRPRGCARSVRIVRRSHSRRDWPKSISTSVRCSRLRAIVPAPSGLRRRRATSAGMGRAGVGARALAVPGGGATPTHSGIRTGACARHGLDRGHGQPRADAATQRPPGPGATAS